jgi:hypothetical protein
MKLCLKKKKEAKAKTSLITESRLLEITNRLKQQTLAKFKSILSHSR